MSVYWWIILDNTLHINPLLIDDEKSIPSLGRKLNMEKRPICKVLILKYMRIGHGWNNRSLPLLRNLRSENAFHLWEAAEVSASGSIQELTHHFWVLIGIGSITFDMTIKLALFMSNWERLGFARVSQGFHIMVCIYGRKCEKLLYIL